MRCDRFAFFLVLLLLHSVLPVSASAQAWLPHKNTGNVSLNYKLLHIKDHTDVNGLKIRAGVIDAHVLSVEVDYGLTRRWAANLSVPYSSVRYLGHAPHQDEHHNLDDGRYHGGFQDFRFGVRYAWLRYTPVVVTPFVEGILPSHNYTTFAHAALGRNLRELLVGANIGWQAEGAPFYSQTRISYGFVEKVLGQSHNRTNIDSQFNYIATSRLHLSALVGIAKHHGGLDWDSTQGPPSGQWTPEELQHHDELTRADMVDIGAGFAFRLKGSTSVYSTLIHSVWSRNAHPWNTGIIAGVNFRFRTRPPAELLPEFREELSNPIPDRR